MSGNAGTASIGAQLRQARRERQLSMSDVARDTKIQPWVLEALEADRLQDSMSPIYVKGFLSTYAKFLQLEPSGLLAQLRWPAPEEAQDTVVPVAPAAKAIPRAVKLPNVPSLPALPKIPALPVIPWHMIRRIAAPAVVAAAVAGLVLINPLRWLPDVTLPVRQIPKLASVSMPKEQPAPPALPAVALTPAQPLELTVTAYRTTWIRIRADGKLLSQQRLQRGANEQWSAKKSFEIVVAKPSQVELMLNGQSISPLAIAHRGRLAITHRGVTALADPAAP